MAPRFPLDEAPDPLARNSIEKSLRLVHERGPIFPIAQADGKAMLGPYGPLSYSTDVAHAICAAGKAAFDPSLVKPRNKELASMALIATAKLPYMVHCHRLVGVALGLTPEQCNDALSGKIPEGLSEEEITAYHLGKALSYNTDPLSDEQWRHFSSKMDRSEIVGIANTIGAYKWIATLVQLNGGGVD